MKSGYALFTTLHHSSPLFTLYFLRLRDHSMLPASVIIEDQRWSSMMAELRDK
ncbi:hypothetical protein KSW85_16320 [Prevotella copri]|uniref:hypothetical protein n=1 Tax=Segatella copri TaxID=165179 RepID=UPI001C391A00|nr:hypothetical protein [Segatella copri]MBV3403324.1 hypothetical protein [Segatella copri]